jgi:hypothetical protein
MLLVEVILAMVVIAVATLSSASMTLSSSNLNKANVAAADATDVMRQLVEELESHPFEEIYARFNSDPTDDPDGAGTARGNQFTLLPVHRRALLDVPGTPGTSDAKTAARRTPFDVDVFFPEDENGLLSELVVTPLWGTASWDIDGDGTAGTPGDRRADYKLLPVAIRITWTDPDGIHALQVVRLLSRRRG